MKKVLTTAKPAHDGMSQAETDARHDAHLMIGILATSVRDNITDAVCFEDALQYARLMVTTIEMVMAKFPPAKDGQYSPTG
jgi:hypothetical protein